MVKYVVDINWRKERVKSSVFRLGLLKWFIWPRVLVGLDFFLSGLLQTASRSGWAVLPILLWRIWAHALSYLRRKTNWKVCFAYFFFFFYKKSYLIQRELSIQHFERSTVSPSFFSSFSSCLIFSLTLKKLSTWVPVPIVLPFVWYASVSSLPKRQYRHLWGSLMGRTDSE